MAGDAAAPASPPPPTTTGTDIFPIERQSQIDVLVVSIVFIILPTLAACLRILARHVAHRRLDASDYCIVAACICANALQAIAIVLVFQGGAGFHFAEIMERYGPAPITKFLKILIPVQIFWAVSLSLCKLSILLMYTKIFTMPSMVVASYATGAFVALWAGATVLSGFLICRPFAFNWDQTLDGTCGNQVLSYTITGALNLTTDVVVFLLPMPYLWNLKLALYKKVVLIVTFGMGLFTIIISTMRLISLQELDYTDITYNIPHALIFGALEPSVGVTLACLPLLRPLLGRSKYSSNGTANYSNSQDVPSRSARSGNGGKSNGFAQLEDDSSEHRLRPLGPKHTVSVTNKATDGSSEVSDQQSLRNEDDSVGIVVKQHWSVSQS